MKTLWKLAFEVLGVLICVGLVLYLVRESPGEAIELRQPPTPLPLQVYVRGSVLEEGVYTLPPGSRVMDAIELAGGLPFEANAEGINPVAYLVDGEVIFIPTLDDGIEFAEGRYNELPADLTSNVDGNLINLNTASQQDLETLPGIGPALAKEIIAYRELNGPFQSIDEVLLVKGIATVKYDQIKELITVGDVP